MREFAFTVTYEPGADPVADVFVSHPSAMSRSLACCVTPTGSWRLDRLTGPEEALDALDGWYLDDAHCTACLGPENCHAGGETEVLSSSTGRRTVYTYRPEEGHCHSVPYLAARHLGDGLLFRVTRQGDTSEWRVLMRDAEPVGALFEAIEEGLREGISLELTGLGEATHWCESSVTVADLPHEQREALRTAVSMGYYETPKRTTVAEVAEALSVPRSTLQYRLQRAEAWLASRFVEAAF
jgi:predicted DNA binding protein